MKAKEDEESMMIVVLPNAAAGVGGGIRNSSSLNRKRFRVLVALSSICTVIILVVLHGYFSYYYFFQFNVMDVNIIMSHNKLQRKSTVMIRNSQNNENNGTTNSWTIHTGEKASSLLLRGRTTSHMHSFSLDEEHESNNNKATATTTTTTTNTRTVTINNNNNNNRTNNNSTIKQQHDDDTGGGEEGSQQASSSSKPPPDHIVPHHHHQNEEEQEPHEPPPQSSPTSPTVVVLSFWDILCKSFRRAMNGGYAGAIASVVQVISLMWLRTCMNYQYRYGGTLRQALTKLYYDKEGGGGIMRLYQGISFAIVQGPLCKFGDTACNNGMLMLLDTLSQTTQALPLPLKTACGSIAAGIWRIFLMPIDTSKTAMQVNGRSGLIQLWSSVFLEVKRKEISSGWRPNYCFSCNVRPLYRGALAQAAATAVGHFPWFATYNFLNGILPIVDNTANNRHHHQLLLSLCRSALLGVVASCVSDCTSNSLRVIKTTKQTITANISYREIVTSIIEKDGIAGLFGRGLGTRLLCNAIQGAVFSIIWKYFQQK